MILERLGSRSDLFGRAGMRSVFHIVSNMEKVNCACVDDWPEIGNNNNLH